MKQNRLIKLLAAGIVSAVALTTAFAQESSISTNAISGSGTITASTPGSQSISLRTEASSQPVRYFYTNSTTIVDPAGKTVERSMLRPDMLVKYTYVQEADRMVIHSITLAKPVSH
jgi:opacity protein-like surface antigen